MNFLNKIFNCCSSQENERKKPKVELISSEIENKKQIYLDMIYLKNEIKHFRDFLPSDGLIPLSAAEIWLLSEDRINYNSDQMIETNYISVCLPKSRGNKPTLVLDLDNTLIFSTTKQPDYFDYVITVKYNSKEQNIWIIERPYLQNFLDNLYNKYELILFTAGIRQYGIKVMKKIDPKLRIEYLLDRRFCTIIGKNSKNQEIYVKNLKILGRDMKKTFIIDDRDYSFCLDPFNGHEIPSFNGDLNDTCLMQLEKYLLANVNNDDLRSMPKIFYN